MVLIRVYKAIFKRFYIYRLIIFKSEVIIYINMLLVPFLSRIYKEKTNPIDLKQIGNKASLI